MTTPPAMLIPATYNPGNLPILDRYVAEAQARGWQVQDLRPSRALSPWTTTPAGGTEYQTVLCVMYEPPTTLVLTLACGHEVVTAAGVVVADPQRGQAWYCIQCAPWCGVCNEYDVI